MTDQPGLTPPSAPSPSDELAEPEEPTAPPWGAAPPPRPPAYGVPAIYQAVVPGTQTHQGALWSMILGIVGLASGVLAIPTSGLTAIGMVCSPVAFGLGLASSNAIKRQPGVFNNLGQAKAGWIMGLIGMVIAILSLLVVLALFALVVWLFASADV